VKSSGRVYPFLKDCYSRRRVRGIEYTSDSIANNDIEFVSSDNMFQNMNASLIYPEYGLMNKICCVHNAL